MSCNAATILLPLIVKLEAGAVLTAVEVDALCEASRTLLAENQLIPILREKLNRKQD